MFQANKNTIIAFTKLNDHYLIRREPADDQEKLSLDERITRLESQLEEKSSELQRARQREKMNDEHNQRLSATVDKLLAESNERLQVHLKERMSSLEEKNVMHQDLERTRRQLDDTQQEKERTLNELAKMRQEMDRMRNDVQQYRSENIQAAVSAALARTTAKKKNAFTDNEWDKIESTNVRAMIGNANSFETSDTECSQTDEGSTILDAMESVGLLSPTNHTDAHTLAMMLQEQLDAINNEIRLIQEEKQNTEQRAEELESQVGSIDSSMSLLSRGGLYDPQQRLGLGISPPQSGRSTPNNARISPSRDYLSQLYAAVSDAVKIAL